MGTPAYTIQETIPKHHTQKKKKEPAKIAQPKQPENERTNRKLKRANQRDKVGDQENNPHTPNPRS